MTKLGLLTSATKALVACVPLSPLISTPAELSLPSFPKYVKIGYSDNVKKRLEELNRSECIPFAFRLYAYYKVENNDIYEPSVILNANLFFESIVSRLFISLSENLLLS